jgi:small RNA 2'-O-methyltransferase
MLPSKASNASSQPKCQHFPSAYTFTGWLLYPRIEHLPDDVLQSFIPTLLGNYSPRLLLLTTPSFNFNTRFRAPGDEDWGCPDPTGRTTRSFRHPDHKFEWTVDECTEWCKAAAQEWGYEVTVDGVGRSITKDPWGRDSDPIRASQAVTFRRREGDEWARKRAAKYAEWAAGRKDVVEPHELLATHRYDAHVGAEAPSPREDIVAAVKTTIQNGGIPNVSIFELWREDSVSTLCAGWLEVLVEALDHDESFVVHKEGKNADDWQVEAPGLELRSTSPWSNVAKPDDIWGESSETTDNTETYDEEDECDEEYDGGQWEETEDSSWAISESEGWNAEDTDVNTMKAWAEWKPAPGWLADSSWDWLPYVDHLGW